jgi:hypothetical protein
MNPISSLKDAEKEQKRGRVKQETPFEELRHAFIVGRPVEIVHTPLSAVSAAEAELTRLETAIKTRKLTCVAQVALVVASADQETFGGKLFVANHSSEAAAQTITAIAALKEPKIAGLVFAVVDTEEGNFEFWTKAFKRDRDTEKVLDLAVADGLSRLHNVGKGKPGQFSA